jgi:hypothetical protein
MNLYHLRDITTDQAIGAVVAAHDIDAADEAHARNAYVASIDGADASAEPGFYPAPETEPTAA